MDLASSGVKDKREQLVMVLPRLIKPFQLRYFGLDHLIHIPRLGPEHLTQDLLSGLELQDPCICGPDMLAYEKVLLFRLDKWPGDHSHGPTTGPMRIRSLARNQ